MLQHLENKDKNTCLNNKSVLDSKEFNGFQEHKPKKKFKAGKFFLIMALFALSIFVQARTNGQFLLFKKLNIPYPIQLEFLMSNNLTLLRFYILSDDNDNFISDYLQNMHYKVYQEIKKLVPEDDPYWVNFWELASRKAFFDYSDELAQEIIQNLEIIVKHRSRVEYFNDYNKFLVVNNILSWVVYRINYFNISELKQNLIKKALLIILPIIEELPSVNLSNDGKFYIINYQNDFYYFSNTVIKLYNKLLNNDSTIACDINISNKTLKNLDKFISRLEHSTTKIKESDVKTLRKNFNEVQSLHEEKFNQAKCITF